MAVFALTMAINDDGTGTPHPNAVWIPEQIIMDVKGKQGSILYVPYHDVPSLLAGEDGIVKCQHNTVLTNALFIQDCQLQQTANTFEGNVTNSLIYITPLVLDVDSGQKDAQANPIMVAFFANATVTQVG